MGRAGRIGRIVAAAALALTLPLLAGATGRLTSLDKRLLAAHNRERAALGVPALAWDPALSADAEQWAAELAASGEFEHSPDAEGDEEPQGENLWLGTSGHYTPEAMVGLWVEEKKDYQPGPIPAVSRTGDFEDVGHYTQLVWADTRKVGCALAEGDEDEVLVCRYSQAGNVEGEVAF
jgi:hypothetical protein